jgi:hypothetical protein
MDYSTLSPTPAHFVVPVFLGGPMDGGSGMIVEAVRVMGTIRHTGGHYSLQGFGRLDGSSAADQAVYEWVPAK